MELSPVILSVAAILLFLGGMLWGHFRACRKSTRDILCREQINRAEIDKARRKSEAVLQNTFSGFAFHELIYDTHGQPVDVLYIDANDRFFELWGFPRDIIGKSMREVVPNFREEWISEYDQVVQTGKAFTRRAFIESLDNYLDFVIFPVEKPYFGAIFHDITLLVKSEQQLKNAIAHVNGIFFSINKNGIFTLSEGLALAKLNSKPGEVVGANAFDFYRNHPDILESLRSCLNGQMVEAVHVLNDTFFDTRYTPVLDTRNNVIGMLGIAVDITQQTLANEEILKNESKYRNIFESIHVGFSLNELVLDEEQNPADIRILYANARFGELYELSQSDLAGKTYSEIFPDFNKDAVLKAFQVISTGKSYTIIRNIPGRKSVERKIFRAESNQFIALDEDITNRISVENELQTSRQKFSGIFNLLPDIAVIVKASDLSFVECNPAFTRLTGLNENEYAGKAINNIGIVVDPEDVRRIIEKVNKKESVHGYELQVSTRDGRIYYFSLSAQAISYEDESCFLGIAQDITERKNIEKTLERLHVDPAQISKAPEEFGFNDLFDIDEIQALQDAFADAAGVASLITTPEGTAITKPSNFCHFCNIIRNTGLGGQNCRYSDGIIGKNNPSGPIIQPCLSGGLWDAGASIVIEGRHIASWLIGQVRSEIQDVDRMRRYATEIGLDVGDFLAAFEEVPVMSEERFRVIARSLYVITQLLSKQAYQMDRQRKIIAERKNMEKQIFELNANLESKITERTEQLQQAIKDQESLAYSISHDLRSPLRHIDGFLQLMINRINSQDVIVKGYFERINQAYSRMNYMIDDLLTFSRLGRKDLELQDVDLNLLVAEVVEQFKVTCQDREVEWKISLLPVIECDRNLFKTVFENLISNALKYTSKKPRAVIEVGAKEMPGKIAEIFIRDNGIGFNMVYANRLFGVFQRLHHNEDYTGSGIGLANVKQVITRHNGKIRAESALNEGATFYITLRCK